MIKAAVTSVISSNQTALTIIREIALLEAASPGASGEFQNVNIAYQAQAVWTISNLIQLDAITKSDSANIDGALESLRVLMRMCSSLASVPASFGSYQLQTGSVQRVLDITQQLLNHDQFPEAELEKIQEWYEASLQVTDLKSVLAGFRCHGIGWHRNYTAYYESISNATRPWGGGSKQALETMLRVRIRDLSGGRHLDFLAFLDTINEGLRIAENVGTGELRKLIYDNPKRPALTGRQFQPSQINRIYVLEQCILPFLELEARCRSAITALAIERYRARHRQTLPSRLEYLVPEFLEAVPVDPFDEQPIKFKQIGSSYRIYSVGIDGDDDGGLIGQNVFAGSPPVPDGDIGFINDRWAPRFFIRSPEFGSFNDEAVGPGLHFAGRSP